MAAGVFEGAISVPGEARVLRSGAVGIWDSTVIAISSTAPAYSLAASMAAMVIAVGFTSPLVVALAFLPVMGIAVAFLYLNRVRQDCGTTFLWVGEALHPAAGFISGWASLSAGVLFMVSASSLAGSYSLNLLGQLGWIAAARVQDQTLVAVVGSLWFALVTFMVVYGITAAARFQRVLLALEYVIVLVFALIGLGKAYSHQPLRGSRHIDAPWFSPTHIGGLSSFAAGAVIAVFFFWGWDTAANINEESANAAQNPGRAGVYSMFALLGIFIVGVLALQTVLSQASIGGSGDVLAVFAATIVPKPWNYLMTLAVLSSTVATLQTTLLPASRVTLSMARERVFPGVFARIDPRFRTPMFGTLLVATLSFAGLAAGVKASSVQIFLTNSVNQVGVLVSLYYGLTGIACTWYFRRILFRNLKTFLLAGLFSGGGGLFMLGLSTWNVINTIQSSGSGWDTEKPVLYSLALGIPALAVAWYRNPQFFRRPVSAYDPASELV